MDVLKVTVLIFLMIVISEGAQRCVNEDCKRQKRDPRIKICKVEDLPEDFKIIEIKTLESKDRDKCVLNENFGFSSDSIWVAGKCEGEFEVCFRKDYDDDLTTKASLPTTTTTTTIPKITLLSTEKSEITVRTITLKSSEPDTPSESTPNVFSNNSTILQDVKRRRELEGIAGILGGVVGALVFMVLFVTVVVVIVKRSPCYSNKYKQHFSDGTHPHKRVSATISTETTMNDETYDTLDMRRESHSYQTCKSALSEPIHMYMTVYDSADDSLADHNRNPNKKANSKNNVKLGHKNMDSDNTIDIPPPNKRTEASAMMTQFGQYGVLDPVETGFYKGLPVSTKYNSTRPVPPLPSTDQINMSHEQSQTELQHQSTSQQQTNTILDSDKIVTIQEVYELVKPLSGDEENASENNSNAICDFQNILANQDGHLGDSENKSDIGPIWPTDIVVNNFYSHMEDFTYVSAQQNTIHKEREDNYDHINEIDMS